MDSDEAKLIDDHLEDLVTKAVRKHLTDDTHRVLQDAGPDGLPLFDIHERVNGVQQMRRDLELVRGILLAWEARKIRIVGMTADGDPQFAGC